MKILMISNHLGVQSGVQRYVQNLLLNLDLTRYQVDLFVGLCPPDQASCAPALEAAGVHIIAVPDNKKARIRALYQHLKTHKDYDIIHYHTASKIGAPVCGMMRVLCPHAKIIVHSHIVYPPMTLTWRAAHLVYQLFADYFLGCGVAAGRFVFGDHIDRRPNFSVACNAVDQTRFYPNAAARTAIRAQYGITGTERLAGFVGRLNHQKNPALPHPGVCGYGSAGPPLEAAVGGRRRAGTAHAGTCRPAWRGGPGAVCRGAEQCARLYECL